MRFRRGNMARVGGLLRERLQEMGIQEKILQQRALSRWPEVVGRQIAASTTPEAVRDGVLFVCCKSSMWSSELSLHKDDIVARLNTAVGSKAIKDIRFTARGFRKAAGGQNVSTAAATTKPEATPEEIKAAEDTAAVCTSDELAERIKQAIIASKLRQKN